MRLVIHSAKQSSQYAHCFLLVHELLPLLQEEMFLYNRFEFSVFNNGQTFFCTSAASCALNSASRFRKVLPVIVRRRRITSIASNVPLLPCIACISTSRPSVFSNLIFFKIYSPPTISRITSAPSFFSTSSKSSFL